MSAGLVASAISGLAVAPWMPRIASWEIAPDDDVWGAHAEVDAETSGPAFRELHALADAVRSVVALDGRLASVTFTEADYEVPIRVWWLQPVERWIVPERCATCPTALGDPGVAFVRLGEPGEREAPVVCIPCRDLMHSEWVSTTCPAADRAEHHWWFSGPDNGWSCTTCRTVRTDPADPATMTRAPRVETGGAA
jgi:hypothetical protein